MEKSADKRRLHRVCSKNFCVLLHIRKVCHYFWPRQPIPHTTNVSSIFMKKILITLLVASALAPAFAQVGMKNSWVAYGSAGYSSSRGEVNFGGFSADLPSVRTL